MKSILIFLRRLSVQFNRLNIVFLCICLVTTGCALFAARKAARRILKTTSIVGHVLPPVPGEGPIVVAAYTKDLNRNNIVHYTVLHDAGEYDLLVGEGKNYVFAYRDLNRNLVYEEGEPAGQYGAPSFVATPGGGVIAGINLGISHENRRIDMPVGTSVSLGMPKRLHSRLSGAIMELDNEIFSEENGSNGYWRGERFYREIGGNIYFLEPYSPDKIPILFIHGATGTPKGWKFFVENIDRSRFQPWFFYYASGTRIKIVSHLLLWKMMNLKKKYNFDRIFITAHSLGGLVARSFLIDYGKMFPETELFISLATPWGGDPMAVHGVQQSPGVIPCWIDMQPHSEFIQSLYKTKLPESIHFYMFYGHIGSRNPFRPNNDGTINLASLLDMRSQSEAKMNYAFNEDHASIIYSPAVLEQYNTIVNAFYDKQPSRLQSGGYLKVNLIRKGLTAAESQAILLLRSTGNRSAEQSTIFFPQENGCQLGPFPTGDYTASVFMAGAKPERHSVPVSVQPDRVNALNFVLTPDGTISGFVTTDQKPKGWPAGMPISEYRPEETIVHLTSITVRGNGIERTIIAPKDGEPLNVHDQLTSRMDSCHNAFYRIFGLPSGEYEIDIKARGYEPRTVRHVVTAGQEKDLVITALTPVKK